MLKYARNAIVAGLALVALVFAANAVSKVGSHDTPLAGSAVFVATSGGHGSGVHIGNGLYITAAHVAKGQEHVTIKTNDGQFLPADVLWINEKYDVALLRTDVAPIEAARLDCARPELKSGDTIEVVGNPLSFRDVHTFGRVSRATERMAYPQYAFIADVTIAPGNSGGPVFYRGRLAGIAVAASLAQVGFGASIIPLSYVVPTSAICTLLGRS